jgi:hypothetical protein
LAGFAQNAESIAGSWQGMLQNPLRPLRMVMTVTGENNQSLKAVFYSIDQSGQGAPAASVTLEGTTFKAYIPAVGGSYEGTLSADGTTITGTLKQGTALPLTLVKTTPATAWQIPEAPAPRQLMPADAKPSFEVATIKPGNPDTPGQAINVGRGGGNAFSTSNTPLVELIKFAYQIHGKLITGGPSWIESDRFDILAKPDRPGIPNAIQTCQMVQELLAERFGLAFHREQKEVTAHVLTVDKGGLKITKAAARGV